MKIISFLGTANYQETTYCLGAQTCRTALFPVALCEFLRPEALLVLVTQQARAKWLDGLKAGLAPLGLIPKDIDIPEGHSVEDLWMIFAALTASLDVGDEVAFDITYSFRTLPFLAFLAASYLRVAKQVTIRGVFYGAWEARTPVSVPPQPDDRSPVFDLTPFMRLLEWTTATDQFLQTGNGQDLAARLPPGADRLADSVTHIAQGLHLLRPLEVMAEAAALPGHVAASASALAHDAPPLMALMERLTQDYGAFGLNNARDHPAPARAILARQLSMIRWYVDKQQYVHGLSLAREWLPSLLCSHFGLDPLDKYNRDDMEALLNFRGGRTADGNDPWHGIPDGMRIRRLWGSNLANLRNDVLHAGFRQHPEHAQDVIRRTQAALAELEQIARVWGIERKTPHEVAP